MAAGGGEEAAESTPGTESPLCRLFTVAGREEKTLEKTA